MSERPEVVLPKLPPHWHASGCDCEPARPYVRVSKVGKREQVISPDLQLRSIVAYAKTHNLRLLDPVCDIDKSGRTFRKRSVDHLIGEITAGKYRRVVLWKWSRWARNQFESTKYLGRVKDAGGRVDSATEDMDQETAMGRFYFDMTMRMDQLQSELISESWSGVHQRRREAGLPHGGRARFGYDYLKVAGDDGTTVRQYVPNGNSTVLAQAYGDFLKGKSINQLVREFNAAGLKTTLGGGWTAQGLIRMLDTGFAAGLIRERLAPSDAPANSLLSYDEWRPGSHKAVIDRAVWDAYKAKRIERAKLPPRSRKAVHALSALLFCSACGRRMVTKYAGAGRTHQWHCAYQRSFHPGVPVMVPNGLTLKAVREWVQGIVGGSIDVASLRARAEAEMAEGEREQRAEEQAIRARIQELEGKVDKLLDTAEGASGRVEQKIKQRLAECEREMAELSSRLGSEPPSPRRVFSERDQEAMRALDAVWDELPPDVLRDGLSKLVSRIEVSPRSESSTRKWVTDRVSPIGVWEEPGLSDWLAERRAVSA